MPHVQPLVWQASSSPNAIPKPSKVSQLSTLSLFISPGPKTMPESRRVHQDEPNMLQNEVILELRNIFRLVLVGSLPKLKYFLGCLLTLDYKKGYLGKKL